MRNDVGYRDGVRWLHAIALLVALCATSLMSVPLVRAADDPQFGIRPAVPGTDPTTSNYFVLKAQGGETVKDAIVVANPGTVPVRVLLYPVDATSGQSGGAIYMTNSEPPKSVGAWIKLEATTIDVPPQKQTTVHFTIEVPAGASIGQHLGGIAAQLDRPGVAGTQGGTNFGITTVTRAVTAVLLNVGDVALVPSLRITGAQVADVEGLPTLTLSIQNDGPTLVKSHGDVTMMDAAGKVVLTSPLALDTLVPQTTIAYPVQADPPGQPGAYRVHATLDFGGAAPTVFDGPVIVTARATATPLIGAPPGRARPTQAAAAAPVTAAEPPKGGGISSTVLILGGISGVLLAVTAGLALVVLRSKRRTQQP